MADDPCQSCKWAALVIQEFFSRLEVGLVGLIWLVLGPCNGGEGARGDGSSEGSPPEVGLSSARWRRQAQAAFPVPLRQVALWLLRLFAGLCGFWRLWLFASFGLFGYCFLDLASRIVSITTTLFESLLPPTHLLLFRLFAEYLHPNLNQLFFKHHGGGVAASPPFLF